MKHGIKRFFAESFRLLRLHPPLSHRMFMYGAVFRKEAARNIENAGWFGKKYLQFKSLLRFNRLYKS